MSITLKTTSMQYEVVRGNGYKFLVQLDYDPEFGWNGHLGVNSYGFKTRTDALRVLKETVAQFLQEEITITDE